MNKTLCHWIGHIKSFIPRGTITGVLWRGSSAAFAFLSNLLLANLLGLSGFGSYAFAVATLNILSILGLMGLDKLSIRELSILYYNRDWARFRWFLRWSSRNLLSFSTALAIVGGLIIFLLPLATDIKRATLLILPAVPLLAYLYLIGGYLQATDRVATGIFFALTFRNFGLVVVAGILFVLPFLRYPEIAVIGHVIIILSGLILSVMVFQSGIREAGQGNYKTTQVSRQWRQSMWSFGVLGILNTLHMDGYILLVGLLLNAEAAGLYAAAHRSATTILLFLGPIEIAVAPLIARAWHQGVKTEVQRYAQTAARLGLAFSLPLIVVFLGMPYAVLSLYGSEYVGAANVLRLLAVGQLMLVVFGPANIVLIMSGYERNAVMIFALSLGLGVLTVLALIPQFGVVGAATGAAAGLVLRALGAAWSVWRKQNVTTAVLGFGYHDQRHP
jgi:O-antigen/teichoic acid export membrane protein